VNLKTSGPNASLRIVADENIPFVHEFFDALGEVTTFAGRTLSAEHVAEADVLLVRSVTKVNEELLAGSRVKFVGTCTIGTDHLDTEYLQSQDIHYASAPGCNANSVVEYVFSVLATLKPDWNDATFGIIGCGNVGGKLRLRLKALGLSVAVYDPFLSSSANPDLASLDAVLEADVICMHTPFTQAGPYPTLHLLDEERLQSLKPGALLINAGRGPAVDNQALKRVMAQRTDLKVALDVWEPEPNLDTDLLDRVHRVSPHIAGYSFDGKVQGTAMIYRALCNQYAIEPLCSADQLLASDESNQVSLHLAGCEGDVVDVANQAILAAYNVSDDDARTRAALGHASCRESDVILAESFDQLRKSYPKRREFPCFSIASMPSTLTQNEKKSLSELLASLGFTLAI